MLKLIMWAWGVASFPLTQIILCAHVPFHSNLYVPPKKFLSSRPFSTVEPAENTYSTSHQVKLLALLFWGT